MIRAYLIEKFNWDESFNLKNDVFNEVLSVLGLDDKINEDGVGLLLIDEYDLPCIEAELKNYTSPEYDQETVDQCYMFLKRIREDMEKNNERVARYYVF